MCEHNKTILTAEDADDSYEDLKKAVLAKQIYGDSYLLMVDTIAQRAVITKVDGTYIADVHVPTGGNLSAPPLPIIAD